MKGKLRKMRMGLSGGDGEERRGKAVVLGLHAQPKGLDAPVKCPILGCQIRLQDSLTFTF